MALTLDATLLAAQSSQSRHPICDLVVRRGVDDLPFPKNPGLSPDTYPQQYASPLVLSDGKLAIFYAGRGSTSSYDRLRVVFSDADRTIFGNYLSVRQEDFANFTCIDAIVMDESNNMGVIVELTSTSSDREYLVSFKVSPSGAMLNKAEIYNQTEYGLLGACTVKVSDNSYTVIHIRKNGSNYAICKRTSTTYTGWSAETILSIGGMTAGRPISSPKIKKLADGTFFLTFTYQNFVDSTGSIYNIWYSTSTDLFTWADALPLTDTALKSRDYSQSDLVQMADGSLFVSALEANTYLSMNKSTSGFVQGTYGDQELTPSDQWLDTAAGKIYVMSMNQGGFRGGVKIDLATWTIDKCCSGSNILPVIPEYFRVAQVRGGQQHGSGGLMPIVCEKGICLLDINNDTYRAFFFRDLSATYGSSHAQNVNWTPYLTGAYNGADDLSIFGAQVDAVNNRLYVHIPNNYIYANNCQFGYIDLDQAGPDYDFTTLATINIGHANDAWNSKFRVYPEQGLMLMYGCDATWGGSLHVVEINNNAIYKSYYKSSYLEFPVAGVIDAHLVGDKIFATPGYSTALGEASKQLVLEIGLLYDTFLYHLPPYDIGNNFIGNSTPTVPQYGMMSICEATKEFIITAYANPLVFNYENYSWEYVNYNSGNAAPPPYGAWWFVLDYDPATDAYLGSNTDNALYLLPRSGEINKMVYTKGVKTAAWAFDAPATLVSGYKNSQGQLAISGSDEVWATWYDGERTAANISWGKTGAQLSLLPYLTDETTAEWSLEGRPNSLSFTLTHGHLFDPLNAASMLNYYLAKGNKVLLKFGEKIAGVDYLVGQGALIVSELSLHYQRGEYPIVNVACEDNTCLWEMHQVTVSQLISSYPDDGIKAIVKAETPLTDADFNLPTFIDRFTADIHWVDAPLSDIIHDLANRFKYFIIVGMDGKVTARRIDPLAAVSNAYPDKTKLIDFTPNDTFSDFTNRITVTGQSLDDIEVVYGEERLASLSGTIGWWGCKKDRYVYYSEDESRTAKYPRLKVLESTTSMMFGLMGGISERISYIDPDDKYCIVEINVPNLIPVLLAGLDIYARGLLMFDYVETGGFIVSGGITIPWGRLIEGIGMTIVTSVLGSVANYQYEIWGQPNGYVKRDYAASANDTALQQQIGMVVAQKEEGFLCFTPAHCQYVADFELSLAMMQRNRVTFTKIAHLKDEVGDIITLPHPDTGNTVKVYIAKLTRKYRPPTQGDNNGYFFDTIEGWIL